MDISFNRTARVLFLSALCALSSGTTNAAPVDFDLEEYAIYAGRNISIRERSVITGQVGAGRDVDFREDAKVVGGVYLGRSSSSRERVQIGGDFLAGRDVYFRYDCIIDGTVESGRRSSISNRTHIKGDLTAGDSISASSDVVVDGTQSAYTTPSMNWVQETVVFPSFAPGNDNLDLAARQTHEIDPGSYRDLYVREYATVKLRSGVYHFRNISMREYLTWEFDDTNGPVVVHVSENMASREGTSFATTSGDSSGLTLWIGRDVSFRESNKFVGQIRAGRGVSFRERFEMTGTVYAERDISIREDSKFKNSTPPPIFYVRRQGSDSNDGRSPATAFRTIQRGVNSCTVAGSVVYVGPGVYEESIDIGAGVGTAAVSGTESKPIRIVGDVNGNFTNDNPGIVVIDGRSSRNRGLNVSGRTDWELSHLTFLNQTGYNIYAVNSGMSVSECRFDVPGTYGVYITASGDVTVEDCVFDRDSDSNHVLWIQPNSTVSSVSVKVNRNDLALDGDKWMSSGYSGGWSAFYSRGNRRYTYGIIVIASWGRGLLDRVEITNNIVSDSYLAIYWAGHYQSSTQATVANNTVTGSMYSIYSYANNAGDTVIANNIADRCYYGTMAYSYRGNRLTTAQNIEHAMTFNMTRYNRPFEFDIISDAPVYVDPSNGDFSLAGGSPGIDAGSNQYAPAVDFNGDSRPTDGDKDGVAIADIGALETINAATKVRVVRWREIGTEHNR